MLSSSALLGLALLGCAHAWSARECCVCAPDDTPGRCSACIPPGSSIVFSGDSIMRYSYLDLVYSLKFGSGGHGSLGDWSTRTVDNPLFYGTWRPGANGSSTREAFTNGTHLELAPEEHTCDCHASPRPNTWTIQRDHVIENRYFRSAACDANVSFVSALHTHRLEGHVRGEFGAEPAQPSAARHVLPQGLESLAPFEPLRWQMSWEEAVRDIVAKHRPTLLVLNQGLWTNTQRKDRRFHARMSAAAEAAVGPRGCVVWKTTTQRRGDNSSARDTKALAAFGAAAVLDAGRLSEVLAPDPSYYKDLVHFQPASGVYRAFNLALLEGVFVPDEGPAPRLACPRGRAFPREGCLRLPPARHGAARRRTAAFWSWRHSECRGLQH